MFVESRSVTCQSSHNFAQLFFQSLVLLTIFVAAVATVGVVVVVDGVDVDAVAAAAVAVVSMKVLSFLHKTKN